MGIEVAAEQKRVIAYCRVSSKGQQEDLKTQLEAVKVFCLGRGLAVDEYLTEKGGGMNFKRKKLLALMDDIERYEVGKLVVAHRDRLVRLGFEWFEYLVKKQGGEMIVINQEQLAPQQEMVEDLRAVVHCFASRLDGLRSYKKQIKEAVENGESNADTV